MGKYKLSDQGLNKIVNALINASDINQSTKSKLYLKQDDSQSIRNKKWSTTYGLLGQNFIMTNIQNVLRGQAYVSLQGTTDQQTEWDDFRDIPFNGYELVTRNLVEPTSRTGDIATDLANITPQPNTETNIVEFGNNLGVDIKTNQNLQAWATLEGFSNWITEWENYAIDSVNKKLSDTILDAVNNYPGYTEIAIDTTGLSNQEIAEAEQTEIMRVSKKMSLYSNEYNELVGSDTEKYIYRIAPQDIEMISSIESSVNNEINYYRNKFVSMNGDVPKDFNFKKIFTENLVGEDQIILLPLQKFHFGRQDDSMPTQLGFSYQNLITIFTFFGFLFIKSAPAVRITATTAPRMRAMLQSNKNKYISDIEKLLAKANDKNPALEQMTAADRQAYVSLLKSALEDAQAVDIEAKMSRVKWVKPPKKQPLNVNIVNVTPEENTSLDNTTTDEKDSQQVQVTPEENTSLDNEENINSASWKVLKKMAKDLGIEFNKKDTKESLTKKVLEAKTHSQETDTNTNTDTPTK